MRNMDNEKLIDLVYQRKQLWDVRDRNYHNRDFSRKLWNEIATELDCTSHLVKSKWQNLRDTYRKEYMKLIRSSETDNKGPHWKYYDRLAFLNDVLALRKKPSPSSLSTGKRKRSRRQLREATGKKRSRQADNHEGDDENDEYTDINPLRYLCEVPQVIADEQDDDASSIHDTISTDAHSAADNQDNNNNHNGERAQTINTKKSSSVKKKIMTAQHIKTTPMEEDSGNQDYSFIESDMQHDDQYDVFNSTVVSDSYLNGYIRRPSDQDEDYHFLMSILPHLREIPKNRKLNVRQKLQQVILDEGKTFQMLTTPLLTATTPQETFVSFPKRVQPTTAVQRLSTSVKADRPKDILSDGSLLTNVNDDPIDKSVESDQKDLNLLFIDTIQSTINASL